MAPAERVRYTLEIMARGLLFTFLLLAACQRQVPSSQVQLNAECDANRRCANDLVCVNGRCQEPSQGVQAGVTLGGGTTSNERFRLQLKIQALPAVADKP